MLTDDSRVLITGGAGFIGGHIAERLLREGHRVRVLDNFSTGKRSTVERFGEQFGDRFDLSEGDLRDSDAVDAAVSGTTHIVHQAALPSVPRSIEDPESTHAVNTTGTLHLLEAARRQKITRFIFAGSSSVYGDQPELPKRESMTLLPKSPYALSKQVGEVYCRLYYELHGLSTLTLRYFNVFGPRQDPDSPYAAVIPLFLRAMLEGQRPQVYGDGEQTRDFTFVSNVVDANLLALEGRGPEGDVLNVACGSRTSLLDLLKHLGEIVKVEIDPEFRPPRSGDVRDSQAAIERAVDTLGFQPRVNLREGLERTVDWFRKEWEAVE